ncbi:hypothetical protein [Cupriavidus sp. CuC1]|uniref:hypothetical protein n=1 Tax=Cupriavidus sp. CuC1 TaxID=3373131 RepID=UPI0037CF57B9
MLLFHAYGLHLAIVNDSNHVVTAYRGVFLHLAITAAPHECNSGKHLLRAPCRDAVFGANLHQF